jgi:Ca2+:H+ antiporter
MKAEEQIHPALKASLNQRINPAVLQHILPLHGKDKDREPPTPTDSIRSPKYGTFRLPRLSEENSQERGQPSASGLTPFLDPSSAAHPTPMRLPSTLTTEDFTRAVAVATVSALKHQRSFMIQGTPQSVRKMIPSASGPVKEDKEEEEEAHGGHEGPSWNRGISAGVLLGCTMLYAMIAGESSSSCYADDRNPGRRGRCRAAGIQD